MVDLLFAEDNAALMEPGTVRTIYDLPPHRRDAVRGRGTASGAQQAMRGCGCTAKRSMTSRALFASPT